MESNTFYFNEVPNVVFKITILKLTNICKLFCRTKSSFLGFLVILNIKLCNAMKRF